MKDLLQQIPYPFGSGYRERGSSAKMIVGTQKAGKPVYMIPMKVRNKNMMYPVPFDGKVREAHLSALPAVDQKYLLLPMEQLGGWVPPMSWKSGV